MPSAWADSVEAERPISAAAAPPRSTYVPPHLRNRPAGAGAAASGVGEAPPFVQSSSFGLGSGAAGINRGGRGLGRTYSNGSSDLGGGGGGGWGASRRFEKEADPFANEVEPESTGLNFDAYEDIPVQASGENIPKPVSTFAEVDFGNALNENIKRCKFAKPTPVQRHAIPISLAGRDLMACAQTGSGKTLAFCFPIISGVLQTPPTGRPRGTRQALPMALILSPTRELCIQIHEQAKKFAYQTGLKVVVVYGGAPTRNQLQELERGADILVATPGRLEDMMERGRIGLSMVRYLALDEADRMLDMGFEPQIRRIVESNDLPPAGARQTMLFSATFPREIQRLASDFLHNYIFLAVGRVGSSTDLIDQRVEYVREHEKRSMLIDLIHGQNLSTTNGQVPLTLVFVETKRGADALEDCLIREGFAATTIHGDRSQQDRETALRSFKSGRTPVLVATDVAARGLDIPHVAHVINYDLPNDIDDYVHRIGRTGRAGKTGMATAFFTDKDMSLAKPLAELMQESNQAVPEWLSNLAAKFGIGGRSGRSGSRFGGRDYRRSRGGPRGDSFGGGGYGGGSSGGGGYHGSNAWEE